MNSCYGTNGPSSPAQTQVCVLESFTVDMGSITKSTSGNCQLHYLHRQNPSDPLEYNGTTFVITGQISTSACVYSGLFFDFTLYKNIIISGSYYVAASGSVMSYSGALIGQIISSNPVVIENVQSSCNITTSNNQIAVGGIVGIITTGQVTIRNSHVKVEFRTSGVVGGLVADFRYTGAPLTISSCSFIGNISTQSTLGSAVGNSMGGSVTINGFK